MTYADGLITMDYTELAAHVFQSGPFMTDGHRVYVRGGWRLVTDFTVSPRPSRRR